VGGWRKGVWVLPASKENFERFEEIAKLKPNMGHDSNEVHCEIMKEAGAEFFKDWRDSDRARGVKEMREGSGWWSWSVNNLFLWLQHHDFIDVDLWGKVQLLLLLGRKTHNAESMKLWQLIIIIKRAVISLLDVSSFLLRTHCQHEFGVTINDYMMAMNTASFL
jgi:hypothetical protein